MNSSANIVFRVREMPSTATRPSGLAARVELKNLLALAEGHAVKVDFDGVVLTPSFADEFLGVLIVELGEEHFKRAVRLVNVPPQARALLQQILARRSSPRRYIDVEAHNALHGRAIAL